MQKELWCLQIWLVYIVIASVSPLLLGSFLETTFMLFYICTHIPASPVFS